MELGGPVRGLQPAEFDAIRRLAYDKFGLDLRSGKEELVAARLGKRMREGGFRSFDQYYQHVGGDRSGEALIGMIDALATNHTSFLREPAHFDFLRQNGFARAAASAARRALERGLFDRRGAVHAGVHAGDQWGADASRKVRILATDISTQGAGGGARRAVYPAERFRASDRLAAAVSPAGRRPLEGLVPGQAGIAQPGRVRAA